MKIKKYHTLGFMLAIMLCGCQQVDKVKTEYLAAFEDSYQKSMLLPPLKIPEDLSYPCSTESYPLPDCLEEGPLPPVCIVPPGFGELSSDI